MLHITLEIENDEDKTFLLPLLQRLGISYSLKEEKLSEESLKKHRQIIERGINVANFDDFMKDFEESRKDRSLPFRNE